MEADLLRLAWEELTPRSSCAIEGMLADDQFLDAAIELAKVVVGEDHLLGWRGTFTSAGPPYEVRLFHGGRHAEESTGSSDLALSIAFVGAIRRWRCDQG